MTTDQILRIAYILVELVPINGIIPFRLPNRSNGIILLFSVWLTLKRQDLPTIPGAAPWSNSVTPQTRRVDSR